MWICKNGAGNGQEVAEVIAVKGELSRAQLEGLDGCFHQKFDL